MTTIQEWKSKKLARFETKAEVTEELWVQTALKFKEDTSESGKILEFKERNETTNLAGA